MDDFQECIIGLLMVEKFLKLTGSSGLVDKVNIHSSFDATRVVHLQDKVHQRNVGEYGRSFAKCRNRWMQNKACRRI
jgi:hypothetical protein